MSTKKKVLILIPDGVGLRNFVFSDFPKIARENNLELHYWNGTNFDLKEFDLKSLKLQGKAHYKTNLFKKVRKDIEIDRFIKKYDNDIYKSYLFKSKPSNLKSLVKQYWVKVLKIKYKNNLEGLRESIKFQERKTSYYENCVNQLKAHQPQVVFCTNQRPVQAIAPIIAAQDLSIPTATFIFSWDNIPKATMVIETDFYFVWSNFMAKQLIEYYPYIDKSQIIVTGSPQFELHSKNRHKLEKSIFLKRYNIPENKRIICFSGDDITTSPHDPEYLNDVCKAVKQLNAKGHNFIVVFRPCPVDFSNRYNDVLKNHKDIVYNLRPKWKKQGEIWNTVLPTPEDQELLYNTIVHSDLIINLGSSMVFDAACHNKACAYINYNPNVPNLKKDVNLVYKYVHFQSMPSDNCVIWLNSKEEIAKKILEGINNSKTYILEAKNWFEYICKSPEHLASKRIIKSLNYIIKK